MGAAEISQTPAFGDAGTDAMHCGAASSPEVRTAWPRFLWVWLQIGLQSFGGGAVTLELIRRTAVDDRGWVSEAEFTQLWGLCQLAPGINLIALAAVVGRRAWGWRGVVLALTGMLAPSGGATAVITAGYATVQRNPHVQAAVNGILPATEGLALLAGYRIALPLLKASRREGISSLLLSLSLLVGAALVFAVFHLPPLAIILVAGSVCAMTRWKCLTIKPDHAEASR